MIRCLIVEDEPLATDVLKDYIGQIPFLQLRGTCMDAIQSLEILRLEDIDLLFLDIHLPGIKGLDFLRTLKQPPAVILTTAYHEYAIQGYELNVVDYLLKPIEFKRFLEAVNKIKKVSIPNIQQEVLTIHSDKKTVLIPIHEIEYLESQKEYIKIKTITSAHLTKYALTRMEEELESGKFLRVHRSFIVALSRIKAFNGHEIELEGKTIPIGRNYREEVAQKLSTLY